MKYLSVKEFGERHGISPVWVRQLCREERIHPVQKVGGDRGFWAIEDRAVILKPPLRPNKKPTKRQIKC